MFHVAQKGGDSMDTTKPIFDDCIQIGGLSINLMRNNKSGKPFIAIEDDEGNLLILEEDTCDEKKS